MMHRVPLVAMETVIRHFKTPEENEDELQEKLLLASSIVMRHLKITEIPSEWVISTESPAPSVQSANGHYIPIEATTDVGVIETMESPSIAIQVPGDIQAAVLFIMGELYEKSRSSDMDLMSESVVNLLAPFRDPTFS